MVLGWENKDRYKYSECQTRSCYLFIISDGILVGLGEISALKGVHCETLAEAQEQIREIQNAFS